MVSGAAEHPGAGDGAAVAGARTAVAGSKLLVVVAGLCRPPLPRRWRDHY